MQRRVVLLMGLLLLCLPAVAQATNSNIIAGNWLLPDDGGLHVIDIMASGTAQVQGMNTNVIVADGGPSVGGTVVGPLITAIDGTVAVDLIFAPPNNTGDAAGPLVFNQLAQSSTTTPSGSVLANGILAHVTINLAGLTAASPGDLGAGKWSFNVSGNAGIGLATSDWGGSIDPAPGGPAVTFTAIDGFIQIVPEPGSIVLCLFGAAGVGIVALRRRRARRAA